MYNIGDRVKVSNDNDNENYDEFRNKTLIAFAVKTNALQR